MALTPADLARAGAGSDWTGDASVISRQVEAMAEAWRRGERRPAEEYIAHLPGLTDEQAIRFVFEEACLRQEAGEGSVSTEILRRFPQWRSKLQLLLDGNRLLRALPDADFPEVGEELGDFRLVAEIGRGAVGRTYLASQRSLADRAVILKATVLGHEEHLSLARLQHMHIVPLYFEQVVLERNLRILGMPHLGGTSLARILAALRPIAPERREGRHILESLDRIGLPLPAGDTPRGPFRNYLTQASYVQAICWIGACLADALQYAHERGLIHMDVKPSNVLLGADGQPMLLDFHLASGPLDPGRPSPDRLGGTPAYMSPEQREALGYVRQGRSVARAVDGRSDLYSLALLLDEALGGDVPLSGCPQDPTGSGGLEADAGCRPPGSGSASPRRRSLWTCNGRVSRGLADLIDKCLADDPRERYQDAASLAADLRRHLNDLPLLGVPNRSLLERWRKWRRRRPAALARSLTLVAATALICIFGVASGVRVHQRNRQLEELLLEGQEALKTERLDEAEKALQRGIGLAGEFPRNDTFKHLLDFELSRVRRAGMAADLNRVITLLRFRTGMIPPTATEARSLLGRGEAIWNLRDTLTDNVARTLGEETLRRVRIDLLDLATIYADLRVRAADRRDVEQARREVLQVLVEATSRFGSTPSLSRELRSYARELGRKDLEIIATPAPRSAWDHYDLGRFFLRSGNLAAAEEQFRRSVRLQPGEFWPNFYQAVCAYRLGHYQDAVTALSVCIALAPSHGECLLDRGLAQEALGRPELALDDYSLALETSPNLAEAAFRRGAILFRLGRLADAAADLEKARGGASDAGTGGRIDYQLAQVYLAQDDRAKANAALERAIAAGSVHARALKARLEHDRTR